MVHPQSSTAGRRGRDPGRRRPSGPVASSVVRLHRRVPPSLGGVAVVPGAEQSPKRNHRRRSPGSTTVDYKDSYAGVKRILDCQKKLALEDRRPTDQWTRRTLRQFGPGAPHPAYGHHGRFAIFAAGSRQSRPPTASVSIRGPQVGAQHWMRCCVLFADRRSRLTCLLIIHILMFLSTHLAPLPMADSTATASSADPHCAMNVWAVWRSSGEGESWRPSHVNSCGSAASERAAIRPEARNLRISMSTRSSGTVISFDSSHRKRPRNCAILPRCTWLLHQTA